MILNYNLYTMPFPTLTLLSLILWQKDVWKFYYLQQWALPCVNETLHAEEAQRSAAALKKSLQDVTEEQQLSQTDYIYFLEIKALGYIRQGHSLLDADRSTWNCAGQSTLTSMKISSTVFNWHRQLATPQNNRIDNIYIPFLVVCSVLTIKPHRLSQWYSNCVPRNPGAPRAKRNSFIDIILIYLLTAIELKPGGRSTVHIYTQTIHRTT